MSEWKLWKVFLFFFSPFPTPAVCFASNMQLINLGEKKLLCHSLALPLFSKQILSPLNSALCKQIRQLMDMQSCTFASQISMLAHFWVKLRFTFLVQMRIRFCNRGRCQGSARCWSTNPLSSCFSSSLLAPFAFHVLVLLIGSVSVHKLLTQSVLFAKWTVIIPDLLTASVALTRSDIAGHESQGEERERSRQEGGRVKS